MTKRAVEMGGCAGRIGLEQENIEYSISYSSSSLFFTNRT